MRTSTGVMIAAVIALAVWPLFFHARVTGDEAFGGADNEARAHIERTHPGYVPWFKPVLEPPSGEIASMLFSLQAALGAGVIGFYFGRAAGRRQAGKGVHPCI